ncbi:lipoyl(octanoyl) transferase LipB [Legionella dresdenensis]|uniref:Octanoyltransferase n=1 Tax=Legionella dresdenensis TaxID=450200 RepID=A0ABV8CBJ2_9GAMM
MVFRDLGTEDYLDVWDKMKRFTANRNEDTVDECWLLQHPSVYTQGQAGKAEHVLNPKAIPIVQSDRGGQVTYHGPGQLVVYTLFDLQRRKMGIRTLVTKLEQLLIALLASYQIQAEIRCGAPGVYVDNKKIASIGLRVKNGCTYHGIALNVDMDLSPFNGINPCGFTKLEMTQIKHYKSDISLADVSASLVKEFSKQFED